MNHPRENNAQALLEKIQSLPAARIAEVEDFVAFLRERDQCDTDRGLTRALTEPTLRHPVGQSGRCRIRIGPEFGEIVLIAFPFTD